MTGKTMDERVGDLEKLAQTLAPLPAEVKQLNQRMAGVESRVGGVEAQIVQLRTEMTNGFSAIRREVKDSVEQVRTELREDIGGLGRDMAQGFLRVEEKTRTLFEEYVARRTVIAEGHPAVDDPPRGA